MPLNKPAEQIRTLLQEAAILRPKRLQVVAIDIDLADNLSVYANRNHDL